VVVVVECGEVLAAVAVPAPGVERERVVVGRELVGTREALV
jgi:hypothetical protein